MNNIILSVFRPKSVWPLTLLYYALALFLASFFVSPKAKYITNWFYLVVTPLILLCWAYWPRNFFHEGRTQLFLIFIGYTTLSCLWSNHAHLFGHTAKILLESFYLLLFFIAIATIKQLPQIKLKWLLDVMVIIASLTSLVVIIKWYNVHPFSNRLHGVFAFSQPIMTAWIYGVPTLICLQRLLSHPNIKIALSYMLLAIPLSAYILLTQSRGPLLGLIIAGLFLILYYRNRRSMLLIVMGLAAFSFYIVSSPSRMLSITNRFDIWQTVFQQGLQAPWFGHGYGTSQTMVINEQGFGHAHNVYLETFYLEGVIGLILLLLLGLAGLKQGLQQFKQPEVVTALAILLFAAICMLTDNQLLVIGPHAVWLNFWAPLFYLLAPNEKVI